MQISTLLIERDARIGNTSSASPEGRDGHEGMPIIADHSTSDPYDGPGDIRGEMPKVYNIMPDYTSFIHCLE